MLRKTLALLSPSELRTGAAVLSMMLLLALVETVGVASVMPFLAVLGNPDLVQSNPWLARAYEQGAFTSTDSFLFALGAGAFAVVVLSAAFRILTTYAINRWTQMRQYSIGARLLEAYLSQPYEFFLDRNSAEMSKSVLSEAHELVGKVLRPGMNMLAYGLVALVLVGFLFWQDPTLALVTTAAVCTAYGLVYVAFRPLLTKTGRDRVRADRFRYIATSQAFGGVKDLKVLGREDAYVERFRAPARRFSTYQSWAATVQAAPRYLIEAVGLGGVLLLALFLMGTREDLGAVLPVLGLYTFAGYRLLPAAQSVYAGFSSLRFGRSAVDTVYEDLVAARPPAQPSSESTPSLVADQEIRFDSVRFCYSGASEPALEDVSFSIGARTSVGFVGRTGSGKSTAIDLLIGLLHPSAGQILVDGVALTAENARGWQRSLGYVSQQIYIMDGSVAENIAFGEQADDIDPAALEWAAKLASAHDFIMTELPNGYATTVGERGVRLSGGQRQRIGIARALYRDPAVLVLDEATNALDGETERAIVDSLAGLRDKKTIIMVAHRLSTIQHCDSIILLENGRLLGTGTFESLKATSPTFRSFAVG